MCVCLPPAVECSETVCGPVLDSSQLSKKICPRLQGKSGARTGAGVGGVDRPLTLLLLMFFFFNNNIWRLKQEKKGDCAYGWCMGGEGGV